MEMTVEARKELIAQAVAAATDGERHAIPWRGEQLQRDVVSIPIDVALLNSRSHRIRAELESHPSASAIGADPYASESQTHIAQLLEEVPGFGDLVDDLREHGQREPGIITEAGVLVNANRRAVALKSAGIEYIKVMVLPRDVTPVEIDRLELDLQVARDYKEPYTFTNELLFIHDLIETGGMTFKQIKDDLRYKNVDAVQQKVRVLGMIRDVQSMNPSIRLKLFDETSVAFEELDRDYQGLKRADPEGAEHLKAARLLAIMAGAGYRDIRFIDADFVDDFLVPAVDNESGVPGAIRRLLDTETRTTNESLGIQLLIGGGVDEETPSGSIDDLYLKIVEAQTTSEVELPTDDEEPLTVSSVDFIHTVRTAVEDATADARDARDGADRLEVPSKYLDQADAKLRKVLDGLAKAQHDPGFDRDTFNRKLGTVERRILAIAELFRRADEANDVE